MQHDYDETSEDHLTDLTDLSDDEIYFGHVIQDDHELLAVDMMLKNALSQVSE